MERIVIEVDDEVAKKWRISSQRMKAKLSQEMNVKLAKGLSDSHEEFMQFLDELGKKAQERGLTEEILEEILKSDE